MHLFGKQSNGQARHFILKVKKKKSNWQRIAAVFYQNVILVFESVIGQHSSEGQGRAVPKTFWCCRFSRFTDWCWQRSHTIYWFASESSLVKKKLRSIWTLSDTFSKCDDWWWNICCLLYLSPRCCHVLWFYVLTSLPSCHSDRHVTASGGRGKYCVCDTIKMEKRDSNWRVYRDKGVTFSSCLVWCQFMSSCPTAAML